jgi:hypothetical protein
MFSKENVNPNISKQAILKEVPCNVTQSDPNCENYYFDNNIDNGHENYFSLR